MTPVLPAPTTTDEAYEFADLTNQFQIIGYWTGTKLVYHWMPECTRKWRAAVRADRVTSAWQTREGGRRVLLGKRVP